MPPSFEGIAGVPYGWRAAAGVPGIFRIGDQGAVIASLAGDGIAIALHSGTSAAQAYLRGGPQAAMGWQDQWRRRSRRPLAIAEARSEEHTSELQSLMRISYAVFCLKKKKNKRREDSN